MAEYLYILINPSLSGLLKIGRTNRSPEERAIELSKGTNMPTPFVVAYEEEVPDSKNAEKLVHDEFTQQGFRVNDSREFFSVPLKVAIQVVARVAQQLRESASNNGEYFGDTTEDNESTKDYYFQQGIDAMQGSGGVLQDYGRAREFFEKAIALGNIKAHRFLAHLYIKGDGVRQSHESALKILKTGGERGDPECFKVMWDIYSGNTVLDFRHEGNAELCFQWYLDALNSEPDSTAFEDYLDHSYEILGGDVSTWGEKKFPINQFPGRFSSVVIELWIEKIQNKFLQFKNLRLAGESFENNDLSSELIVLSILLSNYVQDSDKDILMKRAMQGIKKEDLIILFSKANNSKQVIEDYIPYISISSNLPEKEVLQKTENSIHNPVVIGKSNGFFYRLLSGWGIFNK